MENNASVAQKYATLTGKIVTNFLYFILFSETYLLPKLLPKNKELLWMVTGPYL
jgi:hypothetical protein